MIYFLINPCSTAVSDGFAHVAVRDALKIRENKHIANLSGMLVYVSVFYNIMF